MSAPEPPLLDYHEVRSQIRDLDVIAVRGRGLVSSLIRFFTRSPYTHVGFALWERNEHGEPTVLRMAESRELRGHRTTWLSHEVQVSDCYWFRGPVLPDRERAILWLQRAMGWAPYDYRGVLRLAWWLPTRWLSQWFPALTEALPSPRADSLGYVQRYCMALVSAAFRIGGRDVWPDKPDAAVVPGDVVSLDLVGRLEYVPR